MTEIKVAQASLEVRTVKLTKSLLKQITKVDWGDLRKRPDLHDQKGFFKEGVVVGWIHGSPLGDEWKRYLLLNMQDGSYALVESTEERSKQHKQIYVV